MSADDTRVVADGRAPKGFAPIAIGFVLTLIHLISIPVTNTSVNPARSTGPALFVGGWALQQLWLFWVAPLAGAVSAASCIAFWRRRARSSSCRRLPGSPNHSRVRSIRRHQVEQLGVVDGRLHAIIASQVAVIGDYLWSVMRPMTACGF